MTRITCRHSLGALLATFLLTAGASALEPDALFSDEVWITLGEAAFQSATDVFRSGPEHAALPRLSEVRGVVLTRVPRSGLAALSERIHDEFRHCGGFVRHESLSEALDELERIRAPRRPDGVLPFAIDRADWVEPLVAAIEPANILATMTTLSTDFTNRYHAHPSGSASATWIRNLWTGYAAARPDVSVEFFLHPGITPQPSVVLTIPGSTLADEIVILGGHQDSISSGCSANPNCVAPGADDDASGIASLSEVIRVALASGFVPQRTVQFMAYAAEEVGLDGSTDIAASYLAAGTNVVAVLQLDMTGYNGSATDIAIINDMSYTDSELNSFVGDLIDLYLPALTRTTTTCGYACSDHASWQTRGFRASFPFEAPFGQHNPQIHSVNDTVATLGNSAAHAAKFSRIAAAFLVEASLDAAEILFADGFESSDTGAWSDTEP